MTVCLHCLHAERVAARERRQRFLVRCAVGVLGIAVVAAAGSATLNALPGWRSSAKAIVRSTRSVTQRIADRGEAPAATAAVTLQGSATAPAAAETAAEASEATAAPGYTVAVDTVRHAAPVGATVSAAHPPLAPILAEGRSELFDSLFAVRSGSSVVVYFDTSPTRTRRADKFERIVRQTLASVYGPAADTVLQAIPEGSLVAGGDLLLELPERGIRFALAGGWSMTLWPETRPGRDGPLVVAYRTTVER